MKKNLPLLMILLIFITGCDFFDSFKETNFYAEKGMTNTKLSGLSVEGFMLDPPFSPKIREYTLLVDDDTQSVNITAISADLNASLTLNDRTVRSNDTTFVNLSELGAYDSMDITIHVQADFDKVMGLYNIKVKRYPPSSRIALFVENIAAEASDNSFELLRHTGVTHEIEVSIMNTGSLPLELTNRDTIFDLTGDTYFSLARPFSQSTIDPDGSLKALLTFSTPIDGEFTTQCRITSNAANFSTLTFSITVSCQSDFDSFQEGFEDKSLSGIPWYVLGESSPGVSREQSNSGDYSMKFYSNETEKTNSTFCMINVTKETTFSFRYYGNIDDSNSVIAGHFYLNDIARFDLRDTKKSWHTVSYTLPPDKTYTLRWVINKPKNLGEEYFIYVDDIKFEGGQFNFLYKHIVENFEKGIIDDVWAVEGTHTPFIQNHTTLEGSKALQIGLNGTYGHSSITFPIKVAQESILVFSYKYTGLSYYYEFYDENGLFTRTLPETGSQWNTNYIRLKPNTQYLLNWTRASSTAVTSPLYLDNLYLVGASEYTYGNKVVNRK